MFAGKHGFITPRDLFKWAGRGAVGYQELGENGYLLLAERLRDATERGVVQKAIEGIMRIEVGDLPRHLSCFAALSQSISKEMSTPLNLFTWTGPNE